MTLTTEQLRARIGHLKERLRDMKQHKYPDNCPNAKAYLESLKAERQQDIALLEELLANREAQPVMYASEETLAYAKEGEKSLVTWSEPMGDAVIPLFTLATAQASGVVNLPTEFISDEGVMVRLEQVMAALALVGVKYERRGDACRAAMLNHVGDTNEKAESKCECSSIDYCENCLRGMLAQPVSSGYKLKSPEIPDGCQWTFDEHDSKWDSGCGEAWMFCDGGPTENGVRLCQSCGKPVLLAAAPEGGNDHDTRR
ncbi:hypothetical protein JY494_19080 [Serratia marcescens]|nr:hypothetical protein [Serratia marcescens]